jgi:hypothetical protein
VCPGLAAVEEEEEEQVPLRQPRPAKGLVLRSHLAEEEVSLRRKRPVRESVQ